MRIALRWPDDVPTTEIGVEFHQAMLDRMATSYFKYGNMASAAAAGVDQVESALRRIEKYRETGNVEWLADVANLVMMEFFHPQHPHAHYRPTDSTESPGRALTPKANVMGGMTQRGFSHAGNSDIG